MSLQPKGCAIAGACLTCRSDPKTSLPTDSALWTINSSSTGTRAGLCATRGSRSISTFGTSFRSLTSSTTIRSEEHTSELQSLMRISYAVFCLKKKQHYIQHTQNNQRINTIRQHNKHRKQQHN